jgi:hypothetical protein
MEGGSAMVVNEIAALVTDATPYLMAAAGAYGTAVLVKARDQAADATVSLGRRLLQRVFGQTKPDEPLPVSLAAFIAAPGDPDVLGALRLAIRHSLEADTAMLAEFRQLLAGASVTTVTQHINAGSDAFVAAVTCTSTASPADT